MLAKFVIVQGINYYYCMSEEDYESSSLHTDERELWFSVEIPNFTTGKKARSYIKLGAIKNAD